MTRGEPQPALGRTLYVVATPIGNLRDVTLRALDVLAQVDVVAAEDTRVSSVLLAHHGIRADLLSLNEHNEQRRAAQVVALLESGKRVALVTDAGTPGISDPGARLVRAVRDGGFDVVPVPGPSAVAAALSASGIEAAHWMFCGFLPATASARSREIASLGALPCALVFYEAPHRIVATLEALAKGLGGDRELVIARELTKRFESIHRCVLGEASGWIDADPNRQRGEFVLIVGAPPAARGEDESEHDATLALLLAELPLARAVKLACALTRAPKNKLYERALVLQRTLALQGTLEAPVKPASR
ncbi:MAG: 16S rRNA (cytidine(1402)-2'-O)-methyltransferase [Betaproteobacteria bacterium]